MAPMGSWLWWSAMTMLGSCVGPVETLTQTGPMIGLTPRRRQHWRIGKHRTSPHGKGYSSEARLLGAGAPASPWEGGKSGWVLRLQRVLSVCVLQSGLISHPPERKTAGPEASGGGRTHSVIVCAPCPLCPFAEPLEANRKSIK